MVPASILEEVRSFLKVRFSKENIINRSRPVSGGCIHQAYVLDTNSGPFFLKWNYSGEAANFRAEMRGLHLLSRHSRDFTPTPLTSGIAGEFSFILMKFIVPGLPSHHFWRDFGQKLAKLHQNTSPAFGLDYDNFIGRLPQTNRRHKDFISFFIEERLEPQIKLAFSGGVIDSAFWRKFEKLYKLLPGLIPEETPALLHGDLWHGNFLCDAKGRAKIVDPAVHYGHREAEMAFTRLFGGFEPGFYETYDESYPLHPGWQDRVDLFNLYPLLVHLNLFGKSYLKDINRILEFYREK